MARISIPAKINAMANGESIVIPADDYKTMMRSIGASQTRGYIGRNVSYRKAHIIVGDDHIIGVMITKGD